MSADRIVHPSTILLSLVIVGMLHLGAPPRVAGHTNGSVLVKHVPEAEEEEAGDYCAMRVLRESPLVTIPTAALDGERVSLHMETGYYTVTVPLRTPQDHIEAVYVGAKNLEEVSILLRFLDSKKLHAVKVVPHEAAFRADARPTEEERQMCEAERLKDRLANCTHCRVREFVFGKTRQ